MSDQSSQPLLRLRTPLGDDTLPFQQGTLHAVAVVAREALSQPFEARITVVSTRRSIDPNELVGQPVCLTMQWRPSGERFIHGIVRRMTAVGLPQRDRWQYILDVVPRLRLMDQAVDCRIFQDQTAFEILTTLLTEHNISPVAFRVFDDQPRREYTTQYNETDLGFAHRLMQESGWFYFFEHSRNAHKFVVSDRNQSFRPLTQFQYRVVHAGNNVDVFDTWQETLETAHGRVRLDDYDPSRPGTLVSGQQETTLSTAGARQRRVFHWPAMTQQDSVAAQRARFRVEASEAAAQLASGSGFDPELTPGLRFTLAHDPFSRAANVEYALHSVEHHAVDESWITDGAKPSYRNSFTCFRQAMPWRDMPTLPRPAMAGVFSAVTLGNAGEEIHADPMGRIKVRMMFDYRKDTTAARAIWARVAQPWSGDTWGWQHLPRVGTEVVVAFMNGDPDSPAVIGCLYNQEQPPVFPIQQQQNRQGFRSRSTPNGSAGEFSEFSFDDSNGRELVYLRAQRDQVTDVRQDQTITVFHDHSLTSETGGITVTADAGAIDITAATRISLRVAENTITLTPEAISVLADILNLQSSFTNIEALGDINIESTGLVNVEAAEFIAVPPPDVPA